MNSHQDNTLNASCLLWHQLMSASIELEREIEKEKKSKILYSTSVDEIRGSRTDKRFILLEFSHRYRGLDRGGGDGDGGYTGVRIREKYRCDDVDHIHLNRQFLELLRAVRA